jgi:hypothetical protein
MLVAYEERTTTDDPQTLDASVACATVIIDLLYLLSFQKGLALNPHPIPLPVERH